MICNLKGDVIMKRLISVGEFFELQKSDKKLVVLDCRFDLMNKTYGIDSYKEGVNVNIKMYKKWKIKMYNLGSTIHQLSYHQ